MTRTPQWAIRSAVSADAEALGRIHVEVWRSTYVGLMPAEVLERLDSGRSADHWRRLINTRDPEQILRVVVDEHDRPVGYALGGPPRDPDPPAECELQVINLLPVARGTGVAERLVHTVLGDRAAYLWVLDGNDRAVAFYTRLGFTDDGGRTTHAPSGRSEIRMLRGRVDG